MIGTDVRPEGVPDEAGEPRRRRSASRPPPRTAIHPDDCLPSRADTLMVVHAGGGSFNKVSIPRDTLASIPGDGDEKINAAYAFGGAALQIKTVEDFLGIDINHVVILDFEGFADFIDSIGGVTVNLPQPINSVISGGSDQRRRHAEARPRREPPRRRPGAGAGADPGERLETTSELRRHRPGPHASSSSSRASSSQLTSPWRLPINFIKGPVDRLERAEGDGQRHGRLRAPPARALGGDRRRLGNEDPESRRVRRPPATLIIPEKQCRSAVRHLLGEAGPHPPQCSPGGETTEPTRPRFPRPRGDGRRHPRASAGSVLLRGRLLAGARGGVRR